MNTKRLIIGLVTPFAIVMLALGVLTIRAQQGATGFRVSPARYDLEIMPGSQVTKSIEIRNVTDFTQTAYAVVNDFEQDAGENGTPRLIIDESEGYENNASIKPFVQPIETATIAPDGIAKIDVTFDVPEGTPPGAYYGAVRFMPELSDSGDGQIAISASVGTIFLVTIPGEVVEKLSLVEFSAGNLKADATMSSGHFFASSPRYIYVRLQNEGNTFSTPFGSMEIKDWSGNIVQTIEINNTELPGSVLPNSIRRFDSELKSIGSFGRYTATAFVSYGDGGGNIINAEFTFWVIPWLTILIILLLVVGLVFTATRGIKKYNEHIISRQKGSRRQQR